MAAGFGLVINIIIFVIFLLLLHYVIRNAVDNSETNQTLKEIRDLLRSQHKDDG